VLAELRPEVVFANEDEAHLARELGVERSGVVYVVKRGAEPVLVTAGGATMEVPVERVDDVLDSTGAGDAFAAGLIVAALEGADPRESARAGSVLAMSALRRPGAL
jgi:sugar/nucleoside kinase (ribokinase family)